MFEEFKPSYFLEVVQSVTEEEAKALFEALSLKNRAAVMQHCGASPQFVLAVQRLHDAQKKAEEAMDFMKAIAGFMKDEDPTKAFIQNISMTEDFANKTGEVAACYRHLVYAMKQQAKQDGLET